jgi:hypothetical protein
VPWQLCGYGRSDRSTKLIRGLTSEAAAGFRSRRGPTHDSTLVTPHNAPFSTYKAALIHYAAHRRGGVAARGARAAGRSEKADRRADLMAHAENDAEFHDCLAAFREGLQKLRWVEGRNIQIDSRWGALDDAEAMQRSAKELIALQPDVILTQNMPPHGYNAWF